MDVPPRRPDLVGRAAFLLAAVAGACLLLLVALVCAAVLLRYAANAPILGVNELVQLGGVAVAMLALPWCTAQGGHVRADVFDRMIGRTGRLLGDILSRLLAGGVLAVLAWRAALKMLDAWAFEDATNMLSLPVWPLYGLIAAGTGLAVAVLALQLLALLRRGGAAR